MLNAVVQVNGTFAQPLGGAAKPLPPGSYCRASTDDAGRQSLLCGVSMVYCCFGKAPLLPAVPVDWPARMYDEVTGPPQPVCFGSSCDNSTTAGAGGVTGGGGGAAAAAGALAPGTGGGAGSGGGGGVNASSAGNGGGGGGDTPRTYVIALAVSLPAVAVLVGVLTLFMRPRRGTGGFWGAAPRPSCTPCWAGGRPRCCP